MTLMLTGAERRSAVQALSRQPSPGPDPGGGEAFGGAWREMLRFHNITAEVDNRFAVIDAHIDRYEQATGERLFNPEAVVVDNQRIAAAGGVYEARARAYEELRAAFGAADLEFPDDDGLQEEALARALAARDEAMAIRMRSTSWGSFWGNLAGSMAGAMVDPVNMAAFAFGASWGAGILRTAMIEAGIVAGSQAAIEAGTFGYKRQVDQDWSVRDAATNVAFAGFTGAAFGGGIKTVAVGWRAARARLRGPADSLTGEPPPPRVEEPPVPDAAVRPPGGRPTGVTNRDIDATGVVVARRMPNGKVIYGQPGQTHADLLTPAELQGPTAFDDQMGFARPGGQFLDRKEALALVRQTRPEMAGFGKGRNELEAFEAIQQTFSRDILDAGAVVERQAETVASNPYHGAGIAGETAHRERLAAAEAALAKNLPPVDPGDALSRGTWMPGRVATADGRRVQVRHEVVEADDLIVSHRDDLSVNPAYPEGLQPRDRTRAASADQLTAIASRLDPERLGPSPEAASGAPVIGPDNVVESGNVRVLAVRRAYGAGNGESYRAFLRDLGFDVEGMRQPVLVARRVTSMSEAERADFAIAANRATAARMSAAETAVADARLLDGRIMSLLRDPDVSLASNRDFRRAFVEAMPESERGGFLTRSGAISKEGLGRIEAAMLARAYGEPTLLTRMLEDTDNNIKAIGGALGDAAGRWAAMRDAVSHGTVPASMDITQDLLEALRIVGRARDEGQKVADVARQVDMFAHQSPVTRALLGFMFRGENLTRPTSRADMAAMLTGYADEAIKNTVDPRLFGEALTADNVLATVLKRAKREDLIPAAREATADEAVDKALDAPERIDDTALVEARRMLADGEVAELRMTDPDTGAVVTRKVDDLFREADDEVAAARELELCVTGGIVESAA
jgi:hypothetical protein